MIPFAILSTALLAIASPSTPAQDTESNQPSPLDYVDKPSKGIGFRAEYFANLSLNTPNKAVSVSWKHHVGGQVIAEVTSTFATRYWPTAHVVVDAYTWIIAGTNSDGSTVIEKWDLSKKRGNQAVPRVIQEASIGGVPGDHHWTLPTIREITSLLNHTPQELTTVKFLLWGGPAKKLLYVCFAEDSSLWKMDLGSQGFPMTAIAGQTSSYPILLPELTSYLDVVWGMDHTEHGRAFVIGKTKTLPKLSVVWLDPDEDLVPDNILRLDSSTWKAGGWGDSTMITKSW